MKTTEELISKAVECCSEYLCGECPYNIYEDEYYTLKCIHMLMKDINELFTLKRCIDEQQLSKEINHLVSTLEENW